MHLPRALQHRLQKVLRACAEIRDRLFQRGAARVLLLQRGVLQFGVAPLGDVPQQHVLARDHEVHHTAIVLRLQRVHGRVDAFLLQQAHESGFDLARELAYLNADSPAIILISTRAEADFEGLIAQTPAAGFVPKSELSASAIRRLLG